MNFPVNGKKAAQAAARLIEKSGNPIDYLRLCKLAYLADRQSILSRGVPIIGGSYFSMRKGPTIGEFMGFVNQRNNPPQWNETVSPRFGNEVRLQRSPTFDALSKVELEILDLVVAQHAQRTTDELVQWCHDNCPEYEEVAQGRRKPIPVEGILRGVGKSEKRIQKVLEDARELQEMDALLA
jgi:hypothetical protein